MKKTSIFIQLVALIMFFFIACSPFISIPRENYSELAEESEIVVITISGEKIPASHFWISGDTLFIAESSQLIYKGRNDTILFSEIQEIRDYKHAQLHPAVQIIASIVGLALGAFVAFSFYVLFTWKD